MAGKRKVKQQPRISVNGERSVHIGGSVSNSVIVVGDHNIVTLTAGLGELPTDYSPLIANFLTEYLGTPERPVPFGGRDRELAALTAWLDDPAALPYLLLSAPAGRGKSALLVRWIASLQKRSDLAVVFVPVSVRFQTNLASVVFAALTARLAKLHGEKVPANANTPDEVWQGIAASYLRRALPDGRRLLVVLDGVDEAANWDVNASLFPFEPPVGLRVVVSARQTATRPDPTDWLRALGWDDKPYLAQVQTLDGLMPQGVADVLVKMGVPLDHLGRDIDIVAELHRLSQGDPLLIRLYVDDLWVRGEAAVRLRPDDLRSIRPGYEGYFHRWWEDQHHLWGKDTPLKEPAVQEVLNLLAMALGPLPATDLLHLANPSTGLNAWTLDEALAPLARFVIGRAESGYVLSHPRLRNYFHDRLRQRDPRLAAVLEERFLAWGRQVLANLQAGRLQPRDVPPYLLRYYTAHLEHSAAPLEDYIPLVKTFDWAQAWEALEGNYGGYLGDVQAVWQRAVDEDRRATAHGDPVPHLGLEVRCALIEASISSLGANIPPELLAALVQHGLWTAPQALVYLRQMPNDEQRAEALRVLAPHLPPDLLPETLATAQEISEYFLASALNALAKQLPLGLLPEALAAAQEIRDARYCTKALQSLAPYLPLELLPVALAATREIQDAQYRTEALFALAERLPDLWPEVLVAAREIKDVRHRAEALLALAERFPGLWLEALVAAQEIDLESTRAYVLRRLVKQLPSDLLPNVLIAARKIIDPRYRTVVLFSLVTRLPDLLPETLATARKIWDIDDRAGALVALTAHLPELLPEALASVLEIPNQFIQADNLIYLAENLPLDKLTAVLSAARKIRDAEQRASVLCVLAKRLPDFLPEAVATARKIQDNYHRARILHTLAEAIPELLPEALAAAQGIRDDGNGQANALINLTQDLPQDMLPEVLDTAQKIRERNARAYARILHALAKRLPKLWSEVLVVAREIQDEDKRSEVLSALAEHLPLELWPAALKAAQEIRSEYYRAEFLIGLSKRLPLNLLSEVLAVAQKIKDDYALARVLHILAERLPELWPEALTATSKICDADHRAMALRNLIQRLPTELLPKASVIVKELPDVSRLGFPRAETLAVLAERLPEFWLETLTAIRKIRSDHFCSEFLSNLAARLPAGVLPEALAAALEIQHEEYRSKALCSLVHYLPSDLLPEVLAAVKEISDADNRAEGLIALSERLPDLLPEALATTRKIRDARCRAEALRALSEHLPDLLPEALAAAREIGGEFDRAETLAGLAPHLPENLLREALAAVREIRYEFPRARALAGLAPHLPPDLLREALAAAREIESESDRAEVLDALAKRLADRPLSWLYPLWAETLPVLARRTRKDLLSDLHALTPLIHALGGEQAVGETFRAIQDVGRWWP